MGVSEVFFERRMKLKLLGFFTTSIVRFHQRCQVRRTLTGWYSGNYSTSLNLTSSADLSVIIIRSSKTDILDEGDRQYGAIGILTESVSKIQFFIYSLAQGLANRETLGLLMILARALLARKPRTRIQFPV